MTLKSPMVAEKKFRRLNASERLEEIIYGRDCVYAEPIAHHTEESVA